MSRAFSGLSEWMEGPRRFVVIGVAVIIVGLGAYLLFTGGDSEVGDPEIRLVNAAVGNPAKLAALAGDPRPKVAAAALQQMGLTGHPDAPRLAGERVADPQLQVRRAALAVLGTTKDKAAIPALVKALEDPDPTIRQSAVDALANIPSWEQIDPLCNLLEKEQDDRTRRKVLLALGKITGITLNQPGAANELRRESAATFRRNRDNVKMLLEMKEKLDKK